MGSPKLSRVIQLIRLLQAGQGTSTQDLSIALGCSRRTVFRDIKLLNESGLRILFDHGRGCYFIEERDAIPSLPVDEDEYVTILAAAALSPLTTTLMKTGRLHSAVVKLLTKASPQVRRRVNNMIRSVNVQEEPPVISKGKQTVFEEITRALSYREQVFLKWRDGKTEESRRARFAPCHLTAADGCWWIVGRIELCDNPVKLRLEEIMAIERINEGDDVPLSHLRSHGGLPLASGTSSI